MCGISGFWHRSAWNFAVKPVMSKMLESIHHRGPDGTNSHIDTKNNLAMGHTRLAVVDLHTGAQPLLRPDLGLVLTSNSEFYDYKRIRAEAVCDGEKFYTKTDTEIALYLYQRYGLDFVEHLRGEFALALFDEKKQRLILVRDRFGVRPLYYHISDNFVCYGSEIKAMLRHPQVPKKLCSRAVLHQLMQTMVPGRTAFADIHTLMPGHMLIIEPKRGSSGWEVRSTRYWDMDYPLSEEYENLPDQHYISGVREQLIDAVRVRLEADVPVGCYLSGGIDSCSILGLAGALQQSPVQAFTIRFDSAEYDETPLAKEMSAKVGAKHEILDVRAAELYGEAFRKTLWHAERTFYNTLAVAKWQMSRRVHEVGYKVVLTGEGSDEMFGGYPFFKRDMFLHGSKEHEGDALASIDASNRVFKGAILAEEPMQHTAMEELCGFTPSWIQPWMLTLAQVRPLLSSQLQEELEGYDPIAAIVEQIDKSKVDGRHPLDKVQYTWIKTMLEGQILTWGGDRVDMANAMESRPAFLDHKLADFARTIPPHVRIRNGTEKWVLREAMRNVLPRSLYEREKFAFMAPPAHVDQQKKKAQRRLIEDCLNEDALGQTGLFDLEKIQALVGNLNNIDEKNARPQAVRQDIILNHVIGLQLLHESFVAN